MHRLLVSLSIFITALATFSFGFFHPQVIHASVIDQIDAMVKDAPENLDKYSFNSTNSVAASLSVGLINANNSKGQRITDSSAADFATKTMANLITVPPVQSGEYIADLMHNVGFVQPAYAQGIGFSALTPVLTLWKAFRNLAYFIFIIIFIVVGFMIMFRAQINPQTVVTVQSALPKMVLTLIMITFSYAIAGFVIDLIYLVFFVVTSLMGAFGILSDPSLARNVLFGFSAFRIALSYLISPNELAGSTSLAVGNLITNALIPGLGFLQWIVSPIAYLIIAVAIIIALFRVLFMLIMAWISIILSVIFAPLQLLLNALPNNDTFGPWLKGLLANALIFPAVGIMLLIGVALAGNNGSGNNPGKDLGINPNLNPTSLGSGTGWVPPLITSADVGATGTNQVQAIIGLGIIMILPELAKMIKGLMGAEDKLGLGEAAFGGFKRGVAPVNNVVGAPGRLVGGAFRAAGSYATQYAGVTALEGVSYALPRRFAKISEGIRNFTGRVGGSGNSAQVADKEKTKGINVNERRDRGQGSREVDPNG